MQVMVLQEGFMDSPHWFPEVRTPVCLQIQAWALPALSSFSPTRSGAAGWGQGLCLFSQASRCLTEDWTCNKPSINGLLLLLKEPQEDINSKSWLQPECITSILCLLFIHFPQKEMECNGPQALVGILRDLTAKLKFL